MTSGEVGPQKSLLTTISKWQSTCDSQKTGITQATVSMTLRNHPRVSVEIREREQEMAKELDDRPNPHVTSLMTTIPEGRSPQDYGCIAILIDEVSVNAWLDWHRETYSANYEGAGAHWPDGGGNRPRDSLFPGIDESHEILGRKACEVAFNQLVHNQNGFPEHPMDVLVPGNWIE